MALQMLTIGGYSRVLHLSQYYLHGRRSLQQKFKLTGVSKRRLRRWNLVLIQPTCAESASHCLTAIKKQKYYSLPISNLFYPHSQVSMNFVGAKRPSAEIEDDSTDAVKVARLTQAHARRQLSFSAASSPPVVVSVFLLNKEKKISLFLAAWCYTQRILNNML